MTHCCFPFYRTGHRQDKGTSFLKGNRAADPNFLNIKHTEKSLCGLPPPKVIKPPIPKKQQPFSSNTIKFVCLQFSTKHTRLDCPVRLQGTRKNRSNDPNWASLMKDWDFIDWLRLFAAVKLGAAGGIRGLHQYQFNRGKTFYSFKKEQLLQWLCAFFGWAETHRQRSHLCSNWRAEPGEEWQSSW